MMTFFKKSLALFALSFLFFGCVFQGEESGSFSIHNEDVRGMSATFSWNINVDENLGEARLKIFDKENPEKVLATYNFKLNPENTEYFTYADYNHERRFKVVRSLKSIVSDEDNKVELEGTVEQVEQRLQNGEIAIQTNIMLDTRKNGEPYGAFVAVGILYKNPGN